MKSSKIKFSTASELLREDTFEAERLMELYTLAEYKERQIARLRQEERELTQIINEQNEVISSYGATFDSNSEISNEALPQINLKEVEIDSSKPGSARLPSELEKRPKIAPSGSASNLLDELQEALSNQPMREGHGMNVSRQSHSFVQSRQNFFPIPPISSVLSNLEETTDFNQFFSQFPMTLILISGFYDNNFPIDSIVNSIENWSPQKRQSFFVALFHDMERCSAFINSVFDINNVFNIFNLINIIETKLPKLFNSKRVSFLFYDSPNEELVLNKEKIKIRFRVKPGIFQRSLLTQSPVESNVEDSDVTPSDKFIMLQNKQILIMPVLSIRSQFHVEGLLLFFDKFGGFQSSDYFTTSLIARCLAHILPNLKTMEEDRDRKDAFQKSVDTFVFLCTSSDLKALIDNITESFQKYFNCQAVRIFKVFNKRGIYKEVTKSIQRENSENDDNEYPFSTGIVGSCISECSTVNLTKPQFSENYDTDVDCYDENSFASSLLITTISNENSVSKWAIALYNKKDAPSFSKLDEESLTTICSHLLPLLQNSWREKKMKQVISQSKKQLNQAEALINTIASLKNPTDIESMLKQMESFFRSNTQFSNITLYSLDSFRKELVSNQSHPLDVIQLDSDNPVAECAKTGQMIERENYIDNSVMIFYPILNSKRKIIGVFLLRSGDNSSAHDGMNMDNLANPDHQSNSSFNLGFGLDSSANDTTKKRKIIEKDSINSLMVNFDADDFSPTDSSSANLTISSTNLSSTNNSILISNTSEMPDYNKSSNFHHIPAANSHRHNKAKLFNLNLNKTLNKNGNMISTSTTCFDVNANDENNYDSLDTIKNDTNRSISDKSSRLSCLTLNTFRSSGRIFSAGNFESERSDVDDDSENENALRMMKLWQKVAGSVLEAMQKHLFYSKRKQLIDHMSKAFFDNLFENSFRVWQEVQCLVDDFEDLEITDDNIESPVITDLVFANTSELSEKTIQLIRTLQSLNAIDQSIFTPQKSKKDKSVTDFTVYEEENHGPSFLSTSAVDILSMDEGLVIQGVLSALNELAAIQFLGISENEARDFIIELRALHPPNKFSNWKLAVDHFQFAAFLLMNTNFGKSMSDVEMISTLLFLLSLYSDPPSLINNTKSEMIPMKKTRFTLETSGMFSTISSFFTAYAWCKVNIFKNLNPDDQMNIWNAIDDLEFSLNIDAFIGSPPPILICCLARKSYMMRETGVTIKWFNKKIEEDLPNEILDEIDEIKKFQLDYEFESIIEPMMEEAIKLDPNMNSFLDRYQSNSKSIIGKKTL